ncbi:TIGR04552 family protein/TIGR04562 family protein [Stigmatella aurantiaca]|uniref:TIGR04552 family protein/TIGR04562 family protein n=1 Tax=Stigmatella aurantiaca TaxID=41 RepID=A0A1H8F1M5_STIAU|nr:TIGR04552 family protein [Stigmatella aurantiaca]SEN25625.1 TIGR04552 family protein/TIGR04562 family protein [Stigmatella aurantiaca]
MKVASLVPQLPDLPVRTVAEMGLRELERLRLILRGGSVIDWRRMHFQSREEVDQFLRLCQLDISRPYDEAWARTVLADAVEYLRKTFDYRVAEVVAQPEEIHDLFLFASGIKGPPKYRRIACIVLKVMHVIQHIEGRDLLFRLAVSEAELANLVMSKVMGVAEEIKAKGLPVVEFAHSIKTRDSLVTKLIAKKETVAAQVYDRTRFRIITKSREDILPILYLLIQRLFPFNFVVPGQTDNSLMPFKTVLAENPHFEHFAAQLHLDRDYEAREDPAANQFSGNTYRALNFVVDMPLRMDGFLPAPEEDGRPRKGRIVFTLVEFQIVDEETSRLNEEGDNAHKLYKRRQKRRVLRRLARGLVVPKRK